MGTRPCLGDRNMEGGRKFLIPNSSFSLFLLDHLEVDTDLDIIP